jgi:hypothetical protein
LNRRITPSRTWSSGFNAVGPLQDPTTLHSISDRQHAVLPFLMPLVPHPAAVICCSARAGRVALCGTGHLVSALAFVSKFQNQWPGANPACQAVIVATWRPTTSKCQINRAMGVCFMMALVQLLGRFF